MATPPSKDEHDGEYKDILPTSSVPTPSEILSDVLTVNVLLSPSATMPVAIVLILLVLCFLHRLILLKYRGIL